MDMSLYSDLYKDVHGFRPRSFPQNADECEAEMQYLEAQLVEQMKAEKYLEQEDYNSWYRSVLNIMSLAGISQKDAIRWLMQADGLNYDSDYDRDSYMYNNGLNYSRKREIFGA